jgi:hypothetical protein
MAPEPLTKLASLLIGEVSATPSPANQLDGWIVQKSREDDAETAAIMEKVRAQYNLRDESGRFAPRPSSSDAPAPEPGSVDPPAPESGPALQLFRRHSGAVLPALRPPPEPDTE